ncbi:family 16 glycosylhydrolase, partial [Pseudoalteromonas sp.]|uniref:glycoside hydrolase family 16 protein n=1 Tax=Pseudoalteromonas sp. TaxID=53249 RepID=UPI003565B1BD
MRDSLLTKISGCVITLTAPLLILNCADTSSYITDRLPTAYADYTGEYRGFSLVLDERFEKFNPEVWSKGDGAVGSESVCRFQSQGVEVANGQLNLIIRKEPVASSWSADHQSEKPAYEFSCGELRTQPNKQIKYGRFETRMKAPNRDVASGYISSFFTYTHAGEPKEWEEIDIELEGGRPDKFQVNLIYGLNAGNWWGTRQWGAWEDKINIAPADEWRVYAIEWTPKALKWFVDGQLYKTLSLRDLDC